MINFFKRLFGKEVKSEEPVDKDLEMVRYARRHNVTIVVGRQDVYEYMRSIDNNITILRVGKGYTFEVRDSNAEMLILHESISPEIRQWILSESQFRILEMEK